MARLDRTFSERIVQSLEGLDAGTAPRWGKMNVPQLLGHLTLTVLYSTGAGPEIPYKGNWTTRNVFRFLVLYGVVPIPKGVRVPRPKGMKEQPEPPEATLDDLRTALDTWNARYEQGDLPRQLHPFFGELTPNEWARFHAAHFKHHLTQFGVW